MEDSENLKKKEIIGIIEKENIEFIRFQFVDVFGFTKIIVITDDKIEAAINEGLMFDGSSVDGFARVEESDMYLKPDLDTFKILPWKSKKETMANIFCDIYDHQQNKFEGCPRQILKRAVSEANEMGYDLNVGLEGEFFLFHLDENNNPVFDIHDYAGYFDLSPGDKGEKARRDIMLLMKKYGFSVEASHHEVAPGQHEINFKHDEALSAADNWMIFKEIVRNTAKKHDLYASFIPKPFTGENANAMHCNQSLRENGKNAFFDPLKAIGLSDVAKYYIGGLIKHAKGISAICNPTVNSYKRLVAGHEAPTNIAWSCGNRSAFIRIPESRGASTRIELRTPDPTANPYLVFAVMLKAGLDGIRNKIEPPKEYCESLYELNDKDMKNIKIEKYPRNLFEALSYMKEDKMIIETLGEHAFNVFFNTKSKEWEEYAKEVHPWEIKKYFPVY